MGNIGTTLTTLALAVSIGSAATCDARLDEHEPHEPDPNEVAQAISIGITGAEPIVQIGTRVKHADGSREVHGKRLDDGTLIVMAGTLASKQLSNDGANWSPLNTNLNSGAFLRTELLSNDAVLQYKADGIAYYGNSIWYTTYESESSLTSTATAPSTETIANYVISGLPGNSTEQNWQVHESFKHNGDIYLTVKRPVPRRVSWRGQQVTGTFWDSHLVRANPGAASSFVYQSQIAGHTQFMAARNARPVTALRTDKDVLPLYEADNPRCVGINGTSRIVCAVRTSADDDDGARPMDPDNIFQASGVALGDAYGVIAGSEVQGTPYCRNPWAPGSCVGLEMNKLYKGDIVPVPPLLVAISDNNGATFHDHGFVADRGGIDSSLAYDPTYGVLVMAYGGLTYPRKGIAVQYSLDAGNRWSAPINVADEEGFTDGNVFVGRVGPGRFTLVYSVSPKYRTVQVNEWTSYRRSIQITPQ